MPITLKKNYYAINKQKLSDLMKNWRDEHNINEKFTLHCVHCKKITIYCMKYHQDDLYINEFEDLDLKKCKIKNESLISDEDLCNVCMIETVCKEAVCKTCKKNVSCIHCLTKFKERELILNPYIESFTKYTTFKYGLLCPFCRTKNTYPISKFNKDDIIIILYKLQADDGRMQLNHLQEIEGFQEFYNMM
jgi:hypothetical protein